MKRLLLPLLAALALPTAVNAGVDPAVHNLCKDVSDYMGCVKANSKKEGWNPFKKTTKEKKSKKPFKLSQERKDEWCEYSEWYSENPESVSRCVENLETLGAGILFKPTFFENHKKCNPLFTFTPKLDEYVKCLAKKKDNDIYLIVKNLKNKNISQLSEIQENIVNYGSILNPEESKPEKRLWELDASKDQVTYKGKTYTASRTCPAGEKMYWRKDSGFMRKTKISELGCMTASENEAYWREYKLRQAGAPKGGSGSGAANDMMQRQLIHNNRMRQLESWRNNY